MDTASESHAQGSDKEQPKRQPQPALVTSDVADEVSYRDKTKEIIDELHNNLKTVVVYGPPGVGKTHIAKQVSTEILSHTQADDPETLFAATLWLSLNKQYLNLADRDPTPLLEDLARQLSVLPSPGDDKDSHENKYKRIQELESLILEKLETIMAPAKRTKSGRNRAVLLVLDGAPEKMSDVREEVIKWIEPLESLRKEERLGVLVTRRNGAETLDAVEFLVEGLGERPWMELLDAVAKREELCSEKTEIAKEMFQTLLFRGRTGVSLPPATAVLVVGALKHNFNGENGVEAIKKTLKPALEEAEVARFAFDTLPRDDVATIECCWHSKKFFGCDKNRSVHYNELIASWILEGYFDAELMKHSVENAYVAGYRAFEALSARGLLKAHEGEDFVAMESLALSVPDDRIKGFDERSSLGLPAVFAADPDRWKGLGAIAAAEGVMRSTETMTKTKTLFVDGERLGREVLETFFGPEVKESLETLVVTNPRLRNLDFLAGASKLRILVLRGCGDVLENVDAVAELASLTVLEVSGATRLRRFPEDLFEKTGQIRSLSLAGSRVEWLPFGSFEKLTRLRWLVLRDCSELAELPSLRGFANLEVLDVSGVFSLVKFKNKNFGAMKKLRALDFSWAHCAPLPFVHSLESLTRLTLKGCVELTRLPKMTGLASLRVLEVTGAEKLKEFYGPCLENKPALEILDLSGSALTHLPSSFNHLPKLERLNLSNMASLEDFNNISFSEFKSLKSLDISETRVTTIPELSKLENLGRISLRECRKLESLPAMEGLASLEEIDLSGAAELKEIPEQAAKLPALRRLFLRECKKLKKIAILTCEALEVLDLSGCEALEPVEIEKQPFRVMANLSDLNLSWTKTQCLTSLRCPISLRKLSLRNCVELKEIPAPESLSRLEELNLSGAKSIQNGEAKKFGYATRLRILELSKTSMHVSPGEFAKCTELRELSLRGCIFMEAKIEMQSLTNMEVLDLSEISVGSERKSLRLDDIKGIENLSRLRTLRLWGCEATSFPYWISGLTGLQSLELPDLESVKTLDWGLIKRLPNDLNWEESKILAIAIDGDNNPPSISLTGAKIFEALKKNPKKWDEGFQRFCIYVCPIAGSEEDDDVYRMRDEKLFEDLYMETIRCPKSRRQRFLEIRGFENLPKELGQDALCRIDCLSLVDDGFVKSLSDLGAECFEAMTGLWVDRCGKFETVFTPEKTVKLESRFRILWASNLASLRSLGFRHVRGESFKSLAELYLRCCPVIEYVFEGSSVPENLERLEVMFCPKLRALVECKPTSSSSSSIPNMPRLRELFLVELPELSSFGVDFRCLERAKIDGCPKLEKQSFVDSIGRGVEITCVEESWDGIVTENHTAFTPSLNSNNRSVV